MRRGSGSAGRVSGRSCCVCGSAQRPPRAGAPATASASAGGQAKPKWRQRRPGRRVSRQVPLSQPAQFPIRVANSVFYLQLRTTAATPCWETSPRTRRGWPLRDARSTALERPSSATSMAAGCGDGCRRRRLLAMPQQPQETSSHPLTERPLFASLRAPAAARACASSTAVAGGNPRSLCCGSGLERWRLEIGMHAGACNKDNRACGGTPRSSLPPLSGRPAHLL